MVLALVNVVIRDVAAVVTFGVNFLLFLTPVLYPVPEAGPLATLSKYNPLAVLVRMPCDLALEGTLPSSSTFWGVGGLSLLFFLLCWRMFVLGEMRMTERMGTR
jgi:lipopolysaccharide transport system permease protein